MFFTTINLLSVWIFGKMSTLKNIEKHSIVNRRNWQRLAKSKKKLHTIPYVLSQILNRKWNKNRLSLICCIKLVCFIRLFSSCLLFFIFLSCYNNSALLYWFLVATTNRLNFYTWKLHNYNDSNSNNNNRNHNNFNRLFLLSLLLFCSKQFHNSKQQIKKKKKALKFIPFCSTSSHTTFAEQKKMMIFFFVSAKKSSMPLTLIDYQTYIE